MAGSNITLTTLVEMKQAGEKIVSLTCYDASFAIILQRAGVEILLVGDSLGMVFQGLETTLPVRVDEMIYHSACVARMRDNALLVVDMPFMSYSTPMQALDTAGRLMKEGGAQMVKLEGGDASQLETVAFLSARGVPVCAHLGLLPQSIHKLGGYRVQGRAANQAQKMRDDALALQDAGAAMLVLECIPTDLARDITASLAIPVIGIGAGGECDGQVLVLYDLLGISPGKPAKFTMDFLQAAGTVEDAVKAYVNAVKSKQFPAAEHCYQ